MTVPQVRRCKLFPARLTFTPERDGDAWRVAYAGEAALEWIVKGVLPATSIGGPKPNQRLTGWTFPVQTWPDGGVAKATAARV